MLNKKLLKESIMRGVKESLKSNKAINEGFSAWKEQNAPSFPLEKFENNTKSFISLMFQYMNKHYVNVFKFSLSVDNKSFILSTAEEKGSSMISSGVESLKERCTKGDDQFNRALYKTRFFIGIDEDSDLGKYILTSIKPGSYKIDDMDDLIEYLGISDKQDYRYIRLNINSTVFIDDEKTKKVMDYFS